MNLRTLFTLAQISMLPSLFAAEPEAIRGPSTDMDPFLLSSIPDSKMVSIVSSNVEEPTFDGYRMVGQADGVGAFDNGDETFTVLMSHWMTWGPAEFGPVDIDTPFPARAHGGKGSFVSKWIINKPTHPEAPWAVQAGEDLITSVQLWDKDSSAYETAQGENILILGSATLAKPSAFFNPETGKGTMTRLYTVGEELPPFNFSPIGLDRSDGGRAFTVPVDGPDAGTAFELPLLGNMPFENIVPNPHPQDLTTVLLLADENAIASVYLYIGTKSTEGDAITRAGLTNGSLYGLVVEGKAKFPDDEFTGGDSISWVELGDLSNGDHTERRAAAKEAGLTIFSNMEDGDWDPAHPERFYFTTNGSPINDTIPTRLWRVTLTDITNPVLGGILDVVVDGTDPDLRNFDNISVDYESNVLVQEDEDTYSERLGKVWRYHAEDGTMEEAASHNPLYFSPESNSFLSEYDESTGIIDVSDILGEGWHLMASRAHVGKGGSIDILANLITDPPIYAPGQLLAMYLPSTSAKKPRASLDIRRQGENLQLDWEPLDDVTSYLIEESADLNKWSMAKELPAQQEMTTIVLRQDDFTSKTISWNDWDTTVGQPHGPGLFMRDAEQFILASTGMVASPVNINTAYVFSEMKDTRNYQDGILRLKVSLDTETTWAGGFIRFDLGKQNFYKFELSTARDLMILVYVEGGQGGVLKEASVPIEAGEDWWLEGTADGEQLTLKAWKDGDVEPEMPQLIATDGRFQSGSVGLYANALSDPGAFRATFKEVSWSEKERTPSRSHSLPISDSKKFYRLRPDFGVE